MSKNIKNVKIFQKNKNEIETACTPLGAAPTLGNRQLYPRLGLGTVGGRDPRQQTAQNTSRMQEEVAKTESQNDQNSPNLTKIVIFNENH